MVRPLCWLSPSGVGVGVAGGAVGVAVAATRVGVGVEVGGRRVAVARIVGVAAVSASAVAVFCTNIISSSAASSVSIAWAVPVVGGSHGVAVARWRMGVTVGSSVATTGANAVQGQPTAPSLDRLSPNRRCHR
jgi:hypothetical protein